MKTLIVCFVLGGLATSIACGAQTPERRQVAITFDDLPVVSGGPEQDAWERTTEGILEALNHHDVPAIGFVNESKLYDGGELLVDRVDLLRRWLQYGHELGNHTYSHPKLYDTPTEAYVRDIVDGERITRGLVESVGRSLEYFRHPFLNTGRTLEQRDQLNAFLSAHGYTVAPVTIDNYDFEFASAYERALVNGDAVTADRVGQTYVQYMTDVFAFYENQSRLILRYELPQVLLLHANRLNADWLNVLLSRIAERGYGFITLSEALADEAYQKPDTVVTRFGFSWLHRWAITANMDRSIFQGEPVVPTWVSNPAEQHEDVS